MMKQLKNIIIINSKSTVEDLQLLSSQLPVQVLLNTSKVFKKPGTGQEVENDLLSCVAPLTVGSCNLICESLV